MNVLEKPALWEIEKRVLEIASKYSAQEKLNMDTRLLEDMGLDSLALGEFFLELEMAFGITFPDETRKEYFPEERCLGDVVQMVSYYLGKDDVPQRYTKTSKKTSYQCEIMPSTQLGEYCSENWLAGPLYQPIETNREGFAQYLRMTDGMRCVLLPEAEVLIGNSMDNALADEKPAHLVKLSSFLIDSEPVSNLAFSRFLNSIGDIKPSILEQWCGVNAQDPRKHHFQLYKDKKGWKPIADTENLPMILVSWYGANAYSLWANCCDWRAYLGNGNLVDELKNILIDAKAPLKENMFSNLPSEAQWEYAARGKNTTLYPWGNACNSDQTCTAQHEKKASYTNQTIPSVNVSSRLGMSPFGLHHMSGNVWQWCRDWYNPDFYSQPEAQNVNAQNTSNTGIKSERGGSWVGPKELASSSYRRGRPPLVRGRCLGFRCIGFIDDLN